MISVYYICIERRTFMIKKIIILPLLALLVGCSNSKSSSNLVDSRSISISQTPAPTFTVPTSKKDNTKNENQSSKKSISSESENQNNQKQVKKVHGVTGLISLELADGWEVIPDGYDTQYTLQKEDWIQLRKGDMSINIEASLNSYGVGIGGDPYIEADGTIGNYYYAASKTGTSDTNGDFVPDDTQLTLFGGGYLGYIFDGYGILTIKYENLNGAFFDDPDLNEILETLNVKDCYGTAKVLADKINIRYGNSTDSEIVGTAKKGEKYKVRAVEGDGTYTWYAIGFQDGNPGGSLTWIADKDGKWIDYTENN